MTNVQIYGERELNDILRVLPEKFHSKVILNGLKKAVKPMEQSAKMKAPRRKNVSRKSFTRLNRRGVALKTKTGAFRTGTSGPIHKAITTVRNVKAVQPEVWVAPTKGRTVRYDAWYARFPEFGTRGFGKRKRSSGTLVATGKRVFTTIGYKKTGGGIPAQHFMLKTFEQGNEQARKNINNEVAKEVLKFLNAKVPRYYAG